MSHIPPIFVCLMFSLCLMACKEKRSVAENQQQTDTQIEFKSKLIDFGEIREGEIVARFLSFKNTGNAHFLIKNIDSGCGCTTVNYPDHPIAPGEEGKIEIIFNSSGRYGKQYKEISIFANIPNGKATLLLTAKVTQSEHHNLR